MKRKEKNINNNLAIWLCYDRYSTSKGKEAGFKINSDLTILINFQEKKKMKEKIIY